MLSKTTFMQLRRNRNFHTTTKTAKRQHSAWWRFNRYGLEDKAWHSMAIAVAAYQEGHSCQSVRSVYLSFGKLNNCGVPVYGAVNGSVQCVRVKPHG